jgi:hypothetical protein
VSDERYSRTYPGKNPAGGPDIPIAEWEALQAERTSQFTRQHTLSGGDCVACGASKWLEGTPKLDEPCPVTPEQELAYLRFFHKAASSAFGPADDDIYRLIADNYRDQFGDPPLGYDRDRLNRLEVGEDEE